jgi:bifunctional DNA-binding transcriptional regulator/antitoxin component of YhaV-PrlF toxin-antitoxin module
MRDFTLHMDNQGRILLPSWWRKKQQVGPSDELYATVNEEGGLVIETRQQGLRRARALVRRYIPGDIVLSDELVADRRREAKRERSR